MRLLLLIVLAPSTFAQPTMNILSRVVMVESSFGRGSAFSVDIDRREYWFTAKHLLTGAHHPPYGSISATRTTLRLLNPGGQGEQWLPENFKIIDPGNDIDIAVLAADGPIMSKPDQEPEADSTGMTFGGDCHFVGFPYGGGWRAKMDTGGEFWMPYIKHCTVSGLIAEPQRIWILDGLNNPGFSGGPVEFRGPNNISRIAAVISGYLPEAAEVNVLTPISPPKKSSAPKKSAPANGSNQASQPNPPKSRQTVDLNSGLIVAYDIGPAIAAIRHNPIGALRK